MIKEKTPPKFVHFFGPDGAGKSTQANMLYLDFLKSGIHVRKCWLRSPHTLAFLLWRIFVRIGFYREVVNPFGVPIRLPAVNRNKSLRLWWSLVEFVSVLPPLMRIRLLFSRGYLLIAERFILDTVTSIAWFIDDPHFLSSRLSRQLYLFIPRQTAFIFLDSEYATIFARREHLYRNYASKDQRRKQGLILKAAVEPQAFINFQRRCYEILAKRFSALTIRTELQTPEQTHDIISDYLRSRRKNPNV